MTDDKDFKKVVRERAAKTGERYAAAREQLKGGTRPAAPTGPDAGLELARDELANSLRAFWADFRPTLRGLTDDEYRWEPVAGCPNIRPQEDGTFRCDHQFPVRGAASIAQRLCWAAQLTIVDTNQHFGDKSVTWTDVAAVPGTAAEGIAYLERAIGGWIEALASVRPSFLAERSENRSPGAIDGQFPFVGVVAFHFQLVMQCLAQVSMIRDLYRPGANP